MTTLTPTLSDYSGLPAWCDPSKLAFSMRLDEATPSNNAIKEMHFHVYKKVRRAFSLKVLGALDGKNPTSTVGTAGIFVARHSSGTLDWDNAYGGLKPLLDCMVAPSPRNPSGLAILLDDNPSAMPEPPYVRQLKAKRGCAFTDIFVFDVAP